MTMPFKIMTEIRIMIRNTKNGNYINNTNSDNNHDY